MADVYFTLEIAFDAPPTAVWEELVDWKGHEAWIPATRVELGEGEPGTVGSEFTATSGYGPLALVDRMRVESIEWLELEGKGSCRVAKLGPVLTGHAEFTVDPQRQGTRMVWVEDVVVPYAPQFLAPVSAKLGEAGFRFGMKRLAKILAARPASVTA